MMMMMMIHHTVISSSIIDHQCNFSEIWHSLTTNHRLAPSTHTVNATVRLTNTRPRFFSAIRWIAWPVITHALRKPSAGRTSTALSICQRNPRPFRHSWSSHVRHVLAWGGTETRWQSPRCVEDAFSSGRLQSAYPPPPTSVHHFTHYQYVALTTMVSWGSAWTCWRRLLWGGCCADVLKTPSLSWMEVATVAGEHTAWYATHCLPPVWVLALASMRQNKKSEDTQRSWSAIIT